METFDLIVTQFVLFIMIQDHISARPLLARPPASLSVRFHSSKSRRVAPRKSRNPATKTCHSSPCPVCFVIFSPVQSLPTASGPKRIRQFVRRPSTIQCVLLWKKILHNNCCSPEFIFLYLFIVDVSLRALFSILVRSVNDLSSLLH